MVTLGELGFDITAEKAPTFRSGLAIKLNQDKEVLSSIFESHDRRGLDDDSDARRFLCHSQIKLRHLLPAHESTVRLNAEGRWAIGYNLKTKASHHTTATNNNNFHVMHATLRLK